MTDQLIKKESGLTYRKSLFSEKKGSLALTPTELYFETKNGKQFSVLLKDVINSRAKNGFGNGVDHLIVSYKKDGKETTVKFEHRALWAGAAIGALSQLKEPYFKSWEATIEDARLGKTKGADSGFDAIEKLSNLRDKGVITEEEFAAKKKQMLGL